MVPQALSDTLKLRLSAVGVEVARVYVAEEDAVCFVDRNGLAKTAVLNAAGNVEMIVEGWGV